MNKKKVHRALRHTLFGYWFTVDSGGVYSYIFYKFYG